MTGQGRWGGEPSINFGRLEEMFDDWVRGMRENRPRGSVWADATRQDTRPRAEGKPAVDEEIRVDEYRDGSEHVVRAALPGIDPDQDVDVSAEDGVLRIAVRPVEDDTREYVRRELRRTASSRSLPLPERARPDDITASYRDGVLEIRIPLADPPAGERTRIPVNRG
jgi:HSP20 family protein